jgi:putative sterol carrier protein
MSEAVGDYFTHLADRADGASVAGVTKTCVFEITGAGTWTVSVDNGTIAVREGDGTADCRVATTAAVFERILRRELKPTSAYLTGRMKIRGELAALMRMQPLLDAVA